MIRRFPIKFDGWYAVLSSVLLLPPSSSYVELADGEVRVRMGWGFRATFPVAAVTKAVLLDKRPLSRGVHGLAGRWLVNGSGKGIVVIDLQPAQRARVIGIPVRLVQLMVSLEDPGKLIGLL